MTKLSPAAFKALTNLQAAGKVGAWLRALNAAKVNGNSVNSLKEKGLVDVLIEKDSDGFRQWYYVISEAGEAALIENADALVVRFRDGAEIKTGEFVKKNAAGTQVRYAGKLHWIAKEDIVRR